MENTSGTMDYSALDRPDILRYLFHPRREWGAPESTRGGAEDVLIPVEKGVAIGGRFHVVSPSAPNILFFHGNGEIVADYDDLGHLYEEAGINFLPVDYRGYGRSTGQPTVAGMMRDCHVIFDYVREWLQSRRFSGPMIVMGRSLGSASALELAAHKKERIDGLIIESGFAYVAPLLRILGVNTGAIGFQEEKGFRNVDKIQSFDKPLLIIHAEWDHIIPFSDAQALYNACRSSDKTLLKIPKADHNNIFMRGLSEYLDAVKKLVEKVKKGS